MFLACVSLDPARIWELLAFFAVALLVGAVLSSVCADKITRGVSEKFHQVGDSLKSLNAGQYEPLKKDSGEIEIYALFNEINALNESTHEHIRVMEREQKKLGAVLDNVSQGLVALDEKGRIAFANRSALELFGGTEKAEGKPLAYLVSDSRLCERIAENAVAKEYTFEYAFDGKTLTVTSKDLIRENENKGMSRLLVFTDVTGEREIARQKSDFFANASHELKTPVTVMRGLSELLMEEKDISEKEKHKLERIHKESLRLTSLISDMLKISKLERGETEEEERVSVDLRETVGEVLLELSEAARAKSLDVRAEGEGRVLADPKHIFEIAQNLLSNAVNYNKENGWIKAEISETEESVILKVSDGGIGIEKEHLPRLCERFYRVDKSRSKKTGGTGLGLAIVKHICALYGAKLEIESEFGEGTSVSVAFPKN